MTRKGYTPEESRLSRRLAALCTLISRTKDKAKLNLLADEVEEVCQKLNLEMPDRALLGKPFIPGQTEIAP